MTELQVCMEFMWKWTHHGPHCLSGTSRTSSIAARRALLPFKQISGHPDRAGQNTMPTKEELTCSLHSTQPHSKNKKYFKGPFLVLQLVTNRGLVWVPGSQYSYHCAFRYWSVSPGTERVPYICDKLKYQKGDWNYFFLCKRQEWLKRLDSVTLTQSLTFIFN